MQPEIEAKFLNVDHDTVRRKLTKLEAKLERPMRLMRRTVFDYPDGRIEKVLKGRLRVRDEGDKVTVTYKSPRPDQYMNETETIVGSYDTMVELFVALGLVPISILESKRETWQCGEVEVVLDEWPWAKPFIEIEGKSEREIKDCAVALGFDWHDAVYGSSDNVYRAEYPGMTIAETLMEVPEVRFGMAIPTWLEKRKTK